MNTFHINEMNNVLVKYEIVVKGKAATKVAYFETKEQALDWVFTSEARAINVGAELNLISAEVENQEPKFWDIRKDYWNYRADRNNRKTAA